MLNRRTIRWIIVGLLVSGCSSQIQATSTQAKVGSLTLPATAQLKVGDRVALIGTPWTLRFVAVKSDTRCPVTVQCVQAGEITMQFALESPLADPTPDSPNFTLGFTPGGGLLVTVQGLSFQLQAVTPDRQSFNGSIDPKLYQATVRIQAAVAHP